MASSTANIKVKSGGLTGLVSRFFRAIYTYLGPLKNPEFWTGNLLSHNKAKVAVNQETAQAVPAYFRAVNLISEQFASLSFNVHIRRGRNIETAERHPLQRLFKRRPNPLLTKYDFFDFVVRQVLITGEAFVQIVRNGTGEITSLEVLPKAVDIFRNPKGIWFYKFPDGLLLRYDELYHFKAYTMDGVRGVSPLKIFDETFGRAIAEINFAASYYGNGGHLSSLLIAEKPMTDKQKAELVESFNAGQAGAQNVGKTGYVPFGVKYEKIGSTMQESDYTNARRFTILDVSNITGVNPVFLGDQANLTNTEVINRLFVQYTLRSLCKRFEEEITTKSFSSDEQDRLFVRFNLDSLLRGDTAARANLYKTLFLTKAINPNEIRGFEGLNPYDGGDEFGQAFASNTTEDKTDQGGDQVDQVDPPASGKQTPGRGLEYQISTQDASREINISV